MLHHGEFFSIPPTYTKRNHAGTIACFGLDKVARNVEDVLKLGPPDQYAAGNPVQATTMTLKEISVFPQPVQRPHPQIWEPLTSDRSIHWAAQHGENGYFMAEPNQLLRKRMEVYYETCEKLVWPDRLNRGAFKFGWDAETFDLNKPIDAQDLLDAEIALFGTPDEVGEAILRVKESCGYEDFMVHSGFEKGGFSGEEMEEQMHAFAEDVAPGLRRACGGSPKRGESAVPSFDDVRG